MAGRWSKHANDASYRAGFDEFQKRSRHEESFHQFVRNHVEELDLSSVTSCICIGAGEGDVEAFMINTAMPNLRDFYAVEPNRKSFKILHENIGSITPVSCNEVSTHFYLQSFEDWKGPPEPVDLVMLSHVLYYLDDTVEVFKKCSSWLKDGGKLWIIVNDDVDCFGGKLATQIFPGYFTYSIKPYPDVAKKTGFKVPKGFKGLEIKHKVDYKDANCELLQFYVHRKTTEEDFIRFQESIAEYFGDSEYVDTPTNHSYIFTK